MENIVNNFDQYGVMTCCFQVDNVTQKEEIQKRMTELVKAEPPTLMIKHQTYITKVGKV